MSGASRQRDPQRVIVIVLGSVALLLAILVLANLDWPKQLSERIAEGKRPSLRVYMNAGAWWAALVNVFLSLGLIATRRWWTAPIERTSLLPASVPDISRFAFWLLLLAALVCALWLRAPRMNLSLYNDEAYTVQRHIHGNWKSNNGGFRPVRTNQMLWENRQTNNHVLFVIASSTSLRMWQLLTGAPRDRFNEAALRMPALLAGLASLIGIALVLREVGWARAGVFGAWFAAIHPWHIRYSTEARGYAFVFLFGALLLLFLLRAVRSGCWRHWIGYGVSVFCLMYSYGGALYLPVCLNLVVIFFLWRAPADYPSWKQFVRLATVNVMAAMLFLQLMLPGLLQIRDHFRRFSTDEIMDAVWLREFLSYLLFGMGWRDPQPENPIMISVTRLMTTLDWLPLITLFVVAIAALAGLLRWLMRRGVEAHLAIGMALAAPLGFLQNVGTGSYLFLWYLIFALPVLVIFVATGLDWVGALAPRNAVLSTGAACLFLIVYLWTIAPQISVIRAHSREPLREVIQQMRGREAGPEPLIASLRSPVHVYDARMVQLKEPQQFEELIATARKEQRPLYVAYALRGDVLRNLPQIVARLKDGEFEHLTTLYGLEEPLYTHEIFRLK